MLLGLGVSNTWLERYLHNLPSAPIFPLEPSALHAIRAIALVTPELPVSLDGLPP